MNRYFPLNIIDSVLIMSPPNAEKRGDICIRKGTNICIFIISSVYKSLRCSMNDDSFEDWNTIWRLEVPERIISFVWMVKHNCLIVNQWLSLSLRHLSMSDCPDIMKMK